MSQTQESEFTPEQKSETEADDHKIVKVKRWRESRLFLPPSIETRVTATDHYGENLSFHLINISSFGIRLRASDEGPTLHLNQQLNHLILRIDDSEIFNGRGTVVNESPSPEGPTYGIVLEGYGIDIEKVQALIEMRGNAQHISGTNSIVDISKKVKPEFKIQVANLNAIFQDLRMRLLEEEERIKDGQHSPAYRQKLEEAAIDLAMSLYQNEIHNTFAGFQGLVDGLNSEERVIHKRFFRVNFHPLILGAPFIRRAFTKPLGYAGDYGLMVMFYDYDDHGADLFEKFMHRFACNEPSSIANKNRVEFLCEQLNKLYSHHCATAAKGTEFKVTSVACGPAREIELFARSVKIDKDFPLHLVLVDQEPRALEYAASKIRPLVPIVQVRLSLLEEDAVLGILKKRPFCQLINKSNCIISAGLFDYLSDRVATKLIESLYGLLADHAELFIGNVSRASPDRFSMEFLMEWQLVLRDTDDLRQLGISARIPSENLQVISETLGLNLFLRALKGV